MGWEVERRFKGEGTFVYVICPYYLWLIHVDVWQKQMQYCKTISLQKKKKKNTQTNMTDESLLVLPEPVLFDGACSCFLLTSGVLQQCSALQKSKLVMNLTKVHIFLLGFITFRVFRDDKYSDKLRFCTCFPRFNSTHIQIRKDLASSRKCKKTKKPKTRILANFQLHDSIMRQGSSKPNHPPS